MVSVNLQGGLGNNLFQLATGMSLAEQAGTELKVARAVERYHYGPLNGSTELELDRIFADTSYMVDPAELASERFVEYTHQDMGGRFYYAPPPAADGIRYTGYFQSPKYFLGLDVGRRFALRDDLRMTCLQKYGMWGDMPTVTVHCRFAGDRLRPDTLPYHGVVSKEYYKAAIGTMRMMVEKFRLFVVSDAPADQLREYFSDIWDGELVCPGPCPVEEAMGCMALANGSILGNSTFSWWGAYLRAEIEGTWNSRGSHQPHTRTVAPKTEWFGPANANLFKGDLFHEQWACL